MLTWRTSNVGTKFKTSKMKKVNRKDPNIAGECDENGDTNQFGYPDEYWND